MISIKEHQNIFCNEKFKELFCDDKNEWQKIIGCALFEKNAYAENKRETIPESYFIGIDWLDKETPLFVTPKIKNLDFLQMFVDCFKNPTVANEINKKRGKDPIYKIDTGKKSIKIEGTDFEITPLLVIHFIKVLERICKRGLLKNYIRREENLSAKIKGKIMFAQHFKKNTVLGRADRVYCNFQEHSVDCPENRLLKKALVFSAHYLAKNVSGTESISKINQNIAFCKNILTTVSEVKNAHTLKNVKVNKLFKDYKDGLALAQLILKRFSYNIQETEEKQHKKTPPFWINMSLLFELYTLSKLKEKYGSQIIYQFKGKSDFLKIDEKLIIDAKYKPKYEKKDEIIDDIRQLAGYARDKKVLEKLSVDENTVAPCLIIYPKDEGVEKFNGTKLLEHSEKIKGFTRFYKIGVKLPLKN